MNTKKNELSQLMKDMVRLKKTDPRFKNVKPAQNNFEFQIPKSLKIRPTRD